MIGAESSAMRDDLIGSRIAWQGESWFVALAQHDQDGDDQHWHLTLTAPKRLPKPKRCGHAEGVSVPGCRYCAAAFVAAVAGHLGVEPPAETRKVLDGR